MQNGPKLVISWVAVCVLALNGGAQTRPLPRKSKQPKEQLPGVEAPQGCEVARGLEGLVEVDAHY